MKRMRKVYSRQRVSMCKGPGAGQSARGEGAGRCPESEEREQKAGAEARGGSWGGRPSQATQCTRNMWGHVERF